MFPPQNLQPQNSVHTYDIQNRVQSYFPTPAYELEKSEPM